jgi:hypothetical protein
MQAGLDVDLFERFLLLRRALQLMPEAAVSAHKREVLARCFVEECPPDVMVRRIMTYKEQFPQSRGSACAELEGIRAFYGEQQHCSDQLRVPCALSFGNLVSAAIDPGATVKAQLHPVVYSLNLSRASLNIHRHVRCLSNNIWAELQRGEQIIVHMGDASCSVPCTKAHGPRSILLCGRDGVCAALHVLLDVQSTSAAKSQHADQVGISSFASVYPPPP